MSARPSALIIQDAKGFTLLEVLIVLLIFSLVAAVLGGAVKVSLSTWREANSDIQMLEERTQTVALLEDWISNATAVNPQRASSRSALPLTGTSTSTEFSAPAHPDARFDTLYRVSIRYQSEQNMLEYRLIPDFEALQIEEEDEEDWQPLIQGLSDLSFRYFDARIWRETWEGEPFLPHAVRVELTFVEALSGGLDNMDLIIPIRSEEWAHCNFDLVAKTCRMI